MIRKEILMNKMLHFESKMQSSLFCWFVNILLALLIYYNAELGRLMGIQGAVLSISVIWPGTGFALAALLLFGYKVSPGIFIGNFFYNFIHLYLEGQSFFGPFVVATIISSSSLFEVLLCNYILRKYNTSYYFFTIKDVVIFLFIGLFSSLIASVISVTAIHFYSNSNLSLTLNTALTFWIGDCMGLYVFTPLLVVWSFLKPTILIRKHFLEACLMFFSFVIIGILVFELNYPIAQFYIPMGIWVAYRFRLHGATLITFLITLTVVIPTSIGYGSLLLYTATEVNLFITITFLEILIATTLIFGAILNERDSYEFLLENQKRSFQQLIKISAMEKKNSSNEILIKEKLTSLGLLTAGMSSHLKNILRKIHNMAAETLAAMQFSQPDTIENFLKNIAIKVEQAQKIARALHDQGMGIARIRSKLEPVNINTLINLSLTEVSLQQEKENRDFIFTIFEEFDKNVKLSLLFPNDLVDVFIQLFNNAVRSMKAKKIQLGDNYKPIITVRSKDTGNYIEVVIRDNGQGITGSEIARIFTKNVTVVEHTQKDLSLIQDILVHVYHCKINVESIENEYFEISILFPK